MAIEFNFNEDIAKKVEAEHRPQPLDIGDYTVRIKEAIEQKSKNGFDQIHLTLEVLDKTYTIHHYLTFNGSDWMHNTMKNFWGCFGLPIGNMNTQSWIGKVGKVHTKNDEWGTKVHYFIEKDLPSPEKVIEDTDDLPFF